MNKLVACLALALAPSLLSAVEKPDGLLGTDYAGLSALYANASVEDVDVDFDGLTAAINKNLFLSSEGVGVDLGASLLYVRNSSDRDVAKAHATEGTVDLTLFQDGMIAPFATMRLGFVSACLKDGSDDYDYDSFGYGGTVGAEVHLARGVSMTPYLSYLSVTKDEVGGQTLFGMKTTWWITSRFGVNSDVFYANVDDADVIAFTVGALFHY
jgi:hypothetical protein